MLLAERTAGSESAFVGLMNRTAAAIGMSHTRYADSSGLSAASRSSALDLSRLAARALRLPTFAAIVDTRTASVPLWPHIQNLNRLLWTVPGAIGVKTGYTGPAGNCLVFAARREVAGKAVTLVGAILGEPTTAQMFAAAGRLLDAGFVAMTPVTVWPAGRIVAQLRQAGDKRPLARLALGSALRLPPYLRATRLSLGVRSQAATAAGQRRWQLVVRTPDGAVVDRLPLRLEAAASPS